MTVSATIFAPSLAVSFVTVTCNSSRRFGRVLRQSQRASHRLRLPVRAGRTPILGVIEDSLESSFREVCDKYNYEILSLHISPDHVHLFLSAHPKHAPSKIVRTVKSITAREMWQQHELLLQEYLWGGGFWEESYYVGTAGDVSTDTIEQYTTQTDHV
jgi:putative transposase